MPEAMTPFKPQESLTEQVARHLEDLVAFGQLQSGERIVESTMARQLNVSHGSLREGLRLAERRHLVQNVPRRGTFVTRLDSFFVRSLYDVMALYLSHTGRKFARAWQADDMARLESLYQRMEDCRVGNDLPGFLDLGIHYTQASLAYADNYFIVSAIDDLWPSAKRCAFVAFKGGGDHCLADNLSFMRNSIAAIRQRDQAQLCRIIQGYADDQCDKVIRYLDTQPSHAR